MYNDILSNDEDFGLFKNSFYQKTTNRKFKSSI